MGFEYSSPWSVHQQLDHRIKDVPWADFFSQHCALPERPRVVRAFPSLSPKPLPPARMKTSFILVASVALSLATGLSVSAADFSPRPEERQLPRAMHSQMDVHPSITVGLKDTDIVGSDNRALQAAVDYIGQLGGGTVEIGPG